MDGNTFKPHTGTKTSLLFVQKWNDDPAAGPLCKQGEDYNIFFATQRIPSKDTSGDKIYYDDPFVRYLVDDDAEPTELAETEFLARFGSYEEATIYSVPGKKKGEPAASMTEAEIIAESGSVGAFMDERKLSSLTSIKHPTRFIRRRTDSHGHWIVQHDFFNHEGLTKDGIAEAFVEFAAKEKLSFF